MSVETVLGSNPFKDVFATAGRSARQAVKRGITGLANRHRPGHEKDILILSSPRSGSTWLMELLHTQPNMKYIDEPLAKHILDADGIFPLQTRWRYIDVSPYEHATLANYLKNDRLVRRFGPRNILSREYDYVTDRRVLKLIRACALLPGFAAEGDFDLIYLIRHPIAQAVSAMRRGHEHHLGAYVAGLPADRYGREAKEKIENLISASSDLETFVAAWCLENIVPLRYVESHPESDVFLLAYEELVVNPGGVLKKLAAAMHLNHPDRMMERVMVPSAVTDSATRRTKDRIREGDRDYLVRKWKPQVSKEQERELFSIVRAFGIDIYHAGDVLPHERFLHGAKRDV